MRPSKASPSGARRSRQTGRNRCTVTETLAGVVTIDIAHREQTACHCGSARFITRTAINAALDCSTVTVCALCGHVDMTVVHPDVPITVPRVAATLRVA